MPCRAPAMLRQCRVLRESPRGSRKYPNCYSNSLKDRIFCSVLLPLFTVVGRDRCEEEWYASDNNLRGIRRGSRKKPERGQVAHRPSLDGRAVPWPWEERHGQSMAWAWHGHGMASVNQTRPLCVNQRGKTYSKPLAARHGRRKAWARHGRGMLCVNRLLLFPHSVL